MAPSRSYRLRPAADADLESIWRFSREQWSTHQADLYLRTIIAAFGDLASGTYRGSPVLTYAGYFRLLTGSHVIYYKEQPDHIEVVRVLHQSMDPMRHI